ncbi:uncharacterized protein [Amphiura filiformis]|uniref:uncharacterized protein n=1 Tax=Amphiura filiformis TaxID=82378 RepID=UPI003B227272
MNSAPDIQKFVMKMNMSEHNIEQIMKDYHTTSLTMADFTCSWAKANTKLWWPWIPGRRSRRSDINPLIHSIWHKSAGIINRRKVYLGGMFPNTGIRWAAPGIEIGAQMAVEQINKESTLLPNLELELLIRDTQCNKDIAIYQYFQFMGNKSFPIVGIVGPPCSEECEIIGGVSKYFNTISISYSAESPILSTREGFPFFFRTIPDTTEDTLAYVALFDNFNWNRFSLVAEDTSSYTALALYLQNYLVKQGLSLTSSYRFAENSLQDAAMYIRDIKSKKSHIIIGYVNDYSARKLMCEAYKQGTTSYQGYQWFLPDWYPSQWWDTDFYNGPNYLIREDVSCTTAQMAKAIDGYMSLSRVYIADDKSNVAGGLTVEQWKNWYKDVTAQAGTEPLDYGAYAYDTVWTYAYALNELLKHDETAIDTITSERTTHLYMDILANTSFDGVTGHVGFHGADRYGPISVIQHLSRTDSTSIYCIENLIGQFIPNLQNLTQGTLHLNETHIKWVKGQIPNDGSYELNGCPVENLRAFLGVDCRAALAMVNTLLILTLFVITVAIGIWLKKRYDHKVKLAEERMKELGLLGLGGDALLTLDEWEMPRENVVLNRKLGEGAFGTVYGGEALVDTSKWVAVAVKTLKVDSTIEEKLDFLSEAEMMKRFDHDNIVKLLGVCTRGEPIYAIMEFMLHGDLKTFLLGRRHLVGRDGKEGFEISPHQLSAMVLDIASGLDYLAVNRYVHRDLACRNCLVDAAHTVKIGDFGMTRAMYDSNYYRLGKEGKLPVRWMAPESITEGLFTTKSDVWSLGVVIYEVVTFGSIPYQGLSNADVLDYLRNSNCLSPPRECKPQLAAMMMRCWALDPADRPDAQDVVEILRDSEDLITPCLCEPLASILHEDFVRRASRPQSPMLQMRSGSGGGTLNSNGSLDIMAGLGNRLRASFSKARKCSKTFVNSLNEMDELGIREVECSSMGDKSSQNDDSRPESLVAAINQRSTISVISSTFNYSSSCTSLDQLPDNSTGNMRSVDSGSSSGVECQAEGYSPDSTDQEIRKSSTEEVLYGIDGQWSPRNSVTQYNMEDDLPLIPEKSDRSKRSRSRSEGFKLSGNKQNIKIKTSLPSEDMCQGRNTFEDNTTFV